MDTARRESIAPKHAHDVIAPQQAVDLVSDHVGVAILTQPTARGFHADGVVVKPLSDTSLCFKTCVILRADNTSRLVKEYVRMFLRKYAPQRLPPKRMELSPSARVVSLKKTNRSRRALDSTAWPANQATNLITLRWFNLQRCTSQTEMERRVITGENPRNCARLSAPLSRRFLHNEEQDLVRMSNGTVHSEFGVCSKQPSQSSRHFIAGLRLRVQSF